MYGGFSFCGKEVGELGIQYAPDMSSTYVYGENFSEHTEAFEGHDGSLHYGTTVSSKAFRLRCYFEYKHINNNIIDNVLNFFYRGRTGRLIFEQRDWLWYSATVTSVDTSQLRNYLNGFITINLVAHYPFGRSDILSLDSYDNTENLTTDSYFLDKTGFITKDIMPQTSFKNITKNTTFCLYNPGNEYADVAIAIAGEAGKGITILNETTRQEEGFVAFTKNVTTSANQYVLCDSLNGKTILTDGNNSTTGRIYHDYGFIKLAPYRSRRYNISVTIADNKATSEGAFELDDVGRFINLGDKWYKITTFEDKNTVVFENIFGDSFEAEEYSATIADMNEIVVQLKADAVIDKLDFIYKPTFR